MLGSFKRRNEGHLHQGFCGFVGQSSEPWDLRSKVRGEKIYFGGGWGGFRNPLIFESLGHRINLEHQPSKDFSWFLCDGLVAPITPAPPLIPTIQDLGLRLHHDQRLRPTHQLLSVWKRLKALSKGGWGSSIGSLESLNLGKRSIN